MSVSDRCVRLARYFGINHLNDSRYGYPVVDAETRLREAVERGKTYRWAGPRYDRKVCSYFLNEPDRLIAIRYENDRDGLLSKTA